MRPGKAHARRKRTGVVPATTTIDCDSCGRPTSRPTRRRGQMLCPICIPGGDDA